MRFWIIQAQENPAQSRVEINRREWRSNTICEVLSDRGHEVTRWRSSFSHLEKRYLCQGSLRVPFDTYHHQFIDTTKYFNHFGIARIRSHRALGKNFLDIANCYKQFPDLIHVGNAPTELCYAAVKFGCSRNIPVIIDIRDLWPDIYSDFIPRPLTMLQPFIIKLLRLFFQTHLMYRDAAAINALTTSYLDWGLKLARRKKRPSDLVFPMAYPKISNSPSETAQTLLRTRLGLEPDDIVCCYIGNIGFQSNFFPIIDAARLLKEKCSNLKFILAGNGPVLEKLKHQTCDLDNVILPGWLTSSELHTLMYLSCIGFIPYKSVDNFLLNIPNKFPEYLAGGLVIACGIEGEMGKLVREARCGFIYSPDDSHKLANEIMDVISQKEKMNQMKTNALLLHSERYDGRVIYSQIADYLELLPSQISKNC